MNAISAALFGIGMLIWMPKTLDYRSAEFWFGIGLGISIGALAGMVMA